LASPCPRPRAFNFLSRGCQTCLTLWQGLYRLREGFHIVSLPFLCCEEQAKLADTLAPAVSSRATVRFFLEPELVRAPGVHPATRAGLHCSSRSLR